MDAGEGVEKLLQTREEEKQQLLRRLEEVEKEIHELKEEVKAIRRGEEEKEKEGKEKEGLRESDDGYTRNLIDFGMPEMDNIMGLLNRYYNKGKEQDSKVVHFANPEDLQTAFSSCGVPLPLPLPSSYTRGRKEEGEEEKEKRVVDVSSLGVMDLEKIVGLVLRYSVNTAHPFFLNQLYARVDEVGLLADLIISYLNTNVHTFEVAPVLTLVEKEVVRACCRVVGYKDSESEGLFVPGGAVSNTYALHLARHHACSSFRREGVPQSEWVEEGGKEKQVKKKTGRLIAFTSEEAHYSIFKAMLLCGLGTENLVKVKTTRERPPHPSFPSSPVRPTDFPSLSASPNSPSAPSPPPTLQGSGNGRMCVLDLEKQINKCLKEGNIPFFVSATAGTTVRGAFDPFFEISSLLDRLFPSSPSSPPSPPRPWFHVDACWGAGALFSSSLSPLSSLVGGVELADSVAIDAHKQLGSPLPTALIVTKHQGILQEANGAKASYLFQKNKNNIHMDLGDLTVQCGRRGDAFKLWLMWRLKGVQHFSDRATRTLSLTHHFLSHLLTVDDLPSSLSPSPSPSLLSSLSSSLSGRFVLAEYTGYLNICFWYLPPSLLTPSLLPSLLSLLSSSLQEERGEERQEEGEKEERERERRELWERVGGVAPRLKDRMQKSGGSLIGFQPLGCLPVCFRVVFIHPELTLGEVERLFVQMDQLGKDL